MEEKFWQDRWENGQIGFHENEPNAFLIRHFDALGLAPRSHVFVPLCGKANDIDWLLERGYRVTGIEFNQSAIEEIFQRLSLTPEVAHASGLTRYSSGQLTIWCGDFFLLQEQDLGSVDAVYDRAALVALPDSIRSQYAERLPDLAKGATQLLVSYDYDQKQMAGPPFSVPEQSVRRLYSNRYEIELLASLAITGPLAKRCSGEEQVWLLSPTALATE